MKMAAGIVAAAAAVMLAGCGSGAAPTGSAVRPTDAETLPGGAQRDPTITLAMIEPDDGVGPVVNFIDRATTSVSLGTYDMDPDFGPVVDALLRAQQRGAKVRVMVSATTFPLSGPQTNNLDTEALQAKGIDAQLSDPRFSYYHAKFVLTDAGTPSAQAMVADFNYAASYFGPDPNRANSGGARGMATWVKGPADVAEIARYFDADWPPATQWPPPTRPNILWSPSGPQFENPGNSKAALLSLIRNAQHTLDIYEQQIPFDSELVPAIRKRALAGVKIRMVGNKDGFDPVVGQMLGPLGVQIRLDPTAPEDPSMSMYVHTKTMVVDAGTDRAVAYVGSVNPFLVESLNTERELGVLMTDGPSIGRVSATFDRDFANCTITPEGSN